MLFNSIINLIYKIIIFFNLELYYYKLYYFNKFKRIINIMIKLIKIIDI